MSRAMPSARTPAGVATMPRPVRSNSVCPSSVSMSVIAWLSLGCETPSRCAAREILPWRAASSRNTRLCVFMRLSAPQAEADINRIM